MWSETGRKRKSEGIKILDEESGVLPAQSVHLLSPGRLDLPAHHATQTDKLPPLAQPHNLVRHHSRHVPRACFSYLCGNMRDFCIVRFYVFIFNSVFFFIVLSFEFWQEAVVKEN